jgi:cephalosporin-C deacetylase
MNEYWSARVDAALNAAKGDVSIEDLPIRSNETSSAFSVRFNGVGDYPLYAYLHVPKSDGPHVPLFQAPGYGSVVAVPAYERRSAYVVMALCHRGQRLSNSEYSAAYPGLLTDGLPGEDTYVWGDIVSDCITAVQILLQQPDIAASRLAISGGDLAWITAALTSNVHALQSGGLMFADIDHRMSSNPDYPIAEFNDFNRTHPDGWDEARSTLANFDPMALADGIDARKVMLSAGGSEKDYYNGLASKLSGETAVRVNLGKGHLDHIAQEEWLADACGIEPGPAHYPRTS